MLAVLFILVFSAGINLIELGQSMRQDKLVEGVVEVVEPTAKPEIAAAAAAESEAVSPPRATAILIKTQKNDLEQPTPAAAALHGTLWEGFGDHEIPVTLKLTTGTYALNLLRSDGIRGNGSLGLDDIISEPHGCLRSWATITYPAKLRIKQDCAAYATLRAANVGSWSVSITKVSDEVEAPEPAIACTSEAL